MKKKQYKTSLWELFFTFFKIGAFTFGGGYAMISLVNEEVVERKKWATEEDVLDMVVIAESTPGVIAVNTATSVGYRTHGISGGILATLGVVLPSFLIIFGLSFAIDALKDNIWYQAAFTGVRACVIVLILNAFTKLAGQIGKDVYGWIVLFAAFAVSSFTNFDVIFLIIIGAALGVIYNLIYDKIKSRKAVKTDDNSPSDDESSDKEK